MMFLNFKFGLIPRTVTEWMEGFMNEAITMMIYTSCKCYVDCTPENVKPSLARV
jgi:hypothetical protein